MKTIIRISVVLIGLILLVCLCYGRMKPVPDRVIVTKDYAIYNLGILDGYAIIEPTWLNSAGIVTGMCYKNDAYTTAELDGGSTAFVWQTTRMSKLLPSKSDICTAAYGINDKDESVGELFPCNAMLSSRKGWLNTNGTLKMLPTLGGYASKARAINNLGDVVGASDLTQKDGMQHACLWHGDTITDLGSLAKDTYSLALSINDHRQIVGESANKAFIWDSGKMRELSGIHGKRSSANSINNKGDVVGSCTVGEEGGQAFLWQHGRVKMLTSQATNLRWSEALSISNTNKVVGLIRNQNEEDSRAVLWFNGEMHDLNAILPPNSSILLTRAIRVNDNGDILCIGMADGKQWGFLLKNKMPPH